MPPGNRRHPASGDRLLLAGLFACLSALLIHQDWLWRWDQLIYDNQLQFMSRPADSDIIIIAVDEQSLSEFGRWPWRRNQHAKLLDRLTDESPRVVVLDFIFAEPDLVHPEDDQRLAEAIRQNGNVVLPVLMEQSRQDAIPSETLPFPYIAEQAAGLGHVHVELDKDGFARRLFLYEGLGEAFWPHITIAALQVSGMHHAGQTPPRDFRTTAAGIWLRKSEVLIPFTGGPGKYRRISYNEVVKGEFSPGTFRDKLVLVGVTAAGLGDALPTPVSGLSHAMPGVEINANMLDALLNEKKLAPIGSWPHYLLTLLLAVTPLLFYPQLSPRNSLLLATGLFTLVLLLGTALLHVTGIWFPPVPALISITLSYPLWSWMRLERTMEFLNQELDNLQSQRKQLTILQEFNPVDALAFISRVMPVKGWLRRDSAGKELSHQGNLPAQPYREAGGPAWSAETHSWLTTTPSASGANTLEIFWQDGAVPDHEELLLLETLGKQIEATTTAETPPADMLQARIDQIRAATEELRDLRKFIDDALSFMSDGVLIADISGNILVANERAGWYLAGKDDARLVGRPLLEALQDIELPDGTSWVTLFHSVLLEGTHIHYNAKKGDGRDLLVQIAPLHVRSESIDALVINLSDISNLRASERKRNELLHFLSHDLRSPIVSVLALLELASGKKPPDDIIPLLGRIQGNAEKTLELAEQFLSLAHAESEESYTMKELDLVSVVWNAHEQAWAQAKSRNIRLVNDIDTEHAWILGEGSLLERAIANLLTNAIKYSPPGTMVTTSLTRVPGGYRCCISDQGHGIEKEHIPQLFNRFKRLENPRHSEAAGAGLGLAFVDIVITRHGGQVEVESRPGKGSSFCFTLPVYT